MKVYVMVDIEGISGIYAREQVLRTESRFSEGRRYMTEDINYCVKGLKAAGVDEVIVCDCHGVSYSVIWENLTSEVDFCVSGFVPGKRFYGADDADAIILLGYHAMAGTAGGLLDHTYSSVDIQNIYVNGKAVGEIAFDAAIAGEQGIPVIMVSGDDKACNEAKEILPNVITACVKHGMGSFGAMLLPPEKAHQLIYDKAIEAVKNFKNCKPYTFEKPINCKVEVTERTVIANTRHTDYMKMIDGRTFLVTGDTAEEVLYRATKF